MEFKEIGQQLRLLRKSQGVTQPTMSKELHLARATISAAENAGNVSIKTIVQMADYLGYELKFIQLSRFPTLEELRLER
ncbi:MAG: helix-turn-helix transcriptional regulator [Methylococcales symbiont of Hymedesmia sp. n. MRB-2018]|nr:MAG: helix-turn-helix transcriptional regulator [Methylococcales symbiont of Hymedesmia sp. n. MRB-2018]KAF3984558.1 MAG: helix-turn-helix transcriptional regulator [Methylococcales symbiont of Hymedesmia sp. n. MRB-2018]